MRGTLSIPGRASLFALILLSLAGRAVAEDPTRCIRAELPKAVVMPDGSVHDPGLLRICMTRRYTPVSGLHEIYIDGTFAGLFVSELGKSEGSVERNDPFLFFRANEDRQWELRGYALPDGNGLVTYRLQSARRADRSRPETRIADHGPPPAAPSGWVVLLAAVGR